MWLAWLIWPVASVKIVQCRLLVAVCIRLWDPWPIIRPFVVWLVRPQRNHLEPSQSSIDRRIPTRSCRMCCCECKNIWWGWGVVGTYVSTLVKKGSFFLLQTCISTAYLDYGGTYGGLDPLKPETSRILENFATCGRKVAGCPDCRMYPQRRIALAAAATERQTRY